MVVFVCRSKRVLSEPLLRSAIPRPKTAAANRADEQWSTLEMAKQAVRRIRSLYAHMSREEREAVQRLNTAERKLYFRERLTGRNHRQAIEALYMVAF